MTSKTNRSGDVISERGRLSWKQVAHIHSHMHPDTLESMHFLKHTHSHIQILTSRSVNAKCCSEMTTTLSSPSCPQAGCFLIGHSLPCVHTPPLPQSHFSYLMISKSEPQLKILITIVYKEVLVRTQTGGG